MPLDALKRGRSLEADRRLALLDAFRKDNDQRTREQNYILLKASKEHVDRMLDFRKDYDPNELLFFDWLAINEAVKVEVLDGQHRIEAWEDYVQETGLPLKERWWISVIYNEGW